jgi:hypothetical protein
VHGNHTTPDADILAIVGDVVGQPATDQLIAEIGKKLERSGRFDGVEVRKRFRSIEEPGRHPPDGGGRRSAGIDPLDLTPGPMKKFWSSGMFIADPPLRRRYGFTYGVRTSVVDRFGPRSRVSVPLTWGGERQARVQLERSFKSGTIERVSGEFGISRKENPHYEIAGSPRWLRGATRVSAGALVPGWRRRPCRPGPVRRCRRPALTCRRRHHDRHESRSGVSAECRARPLSESIG